MRFRLLALFILTAIGLAGCDISPEDHRSELHVQVKAGQVKTGQVKTGVNLAETIAVKADSHSVQKRFPS